MYRGEHSTWIRDPIESPLAQARPLPTRFDGRRAPSAPGAVCCVSVCYRPDSCNTLVGSGTGTVIRRQPLGRVRFPPVCPCRGRRNSVSSSRRIARRMRIYRTTRSCTASRQGLWAIASVSCRPVTGQYATRYSWNSPSVLYTGNHGSTASTRNRDAGLPGPGGAAPSSLPSLGCMRSSDSSDRTQSPAPSPAGWD